MGGGAEKIPSLISLTGAAWLEVEGGLELGRSQ